MMTSEIELQKLATLASIEITKDSALHWAQDVSLIMGFVEQLRDVNTTSIAPLLHPLDLRQRLRKDTITEQNCVLALADIAPEFADGLYLVPKVIATEK